MKKKNQLWFFFDKSTMIGLAAGPIPTLFPFLLTVDKKNSIKEYLKFMTKKKSI